MATINCTQSKVNHVALEESLLFKRIVYISSVGLGFGFMIHSVMIATAVKVIGLSLIGLSLLTLIVTLVSKITNRNSIGKFQKDINRHIKSLPVYIPMLIKSVKK